MASSAVAAASVAQRGEWQAAIALARFVYNFSFELRQPMSFAPCFHCIRVYYSEIDVRACDPCTRAICASAIKINYLRQIPHKKLLPVLSPGAKRPLCARKVCLVQVSSEQNIIYNIQEQNIYLYPRMPKQPFNSHKEVAPNLIELNKNLGFRQFDAEGRYMQIFMLNHFAKMFECNEFDVLR